MAPALSRIAPVLVFLLLGVVAPGGGPARADDALPVQYLVERDPFRAVTAGQPLGFELYADPACSARLVHAERLIVGQPGLYAERVELEAVHQQTRVTPSAVRLAATLKPPAVEGLLYLKVTGSGIVPINGESCQTQVSAVTLRGPAGAAGLAGPQDRKSVV